MGPATARVAAQAHRVAPVRQDPEKQSGRTRTGYPAGLRTDGASRPGAIRPFLLPDMTEMLWQEAAPASPMNAVLKGKTTARSLIGTIYQPLIEIQGGILV
jgi:hypothetical protein